LRAERVRIAPPTAPKPRIIRPHVAPAGTPPATVKWIADHAKAALDKPELSKRLIDAAITPAFMPTEEFRKFVAGEVTRWGKRIDAAGIQPE